MVDDEALEPRQMPATPTNAATANPLASVSAPAATIEFVGRVAANDFVQRSFLIENGVAEFNLKTFTDSD